VLIYVSVAERYAEIIADTGIDKVVPKGTWQAIIDDLTLRLSDGRPGDGFVEAIERVGALLSKHFPPGTRDPNELPNHLIIIE
jgi:putative membrane protein